MTAITRASVKGGSKTVLRALMASCFAVTLAGCYQTEVAEKEYPTDYRQRHPIVLREGAQNVDIPAWPQSRRIDPEPARRCRFFCPGLAQGTGSGIIIEVPKAARPIMPPPMQRARSVRSLLPSACRRTRSTRAVISPPKTSLASIRLNYTKLIAEAGPVRRMAKGSRPVMGLGICLKPTVLEFRLCHAAQPCGHGRQSRRPGAAARRGSGICAAPLGRARQVRKGENPSGIYVGYEAGKISDLGK